MLNRIEKSLSRKSEQHLQLSLTIDLQSFEVMLCSFCISKGLECKMMEGTKRYSCCIRRDRSCDNSDVPVNACEFHSFSKFFLVRFLILMIVSRITTELGCLDQKELDAEEVLLELQSKLGKATARLVRLRKQKCSLHDCSAKMVS
ncbi:hypothetical protein M406DRAFT_261209 [Cryphonectria parasitica EP155]|uniref:Uncharacterized protein n=1 Tax=Cryphonectria parasitica (strain ATCC 38755 / EP155) TaxID=660469 RepID=A0A9P4Y002_CRYP1|nr:uncharacterized protein M406DRAFT_261209 [Cryphonectria parasitica EP155]KAF3764041.1 hypothetical protein M406DRAFT_261209 [Cryphonectria parasitica EP155]